MTTNLNNQVLNLNARQILLKRGNATTMSTYVGPLGEIVLDTTLHTLRIQDGVTPGGTPLSSGGTTGGVRGYTGSQGDVGATGVTGPQGIFGYTGSQGIAGDLGATGPQGIFGYTGSQGIAGDLGATGPQGTNGDRLVNGVNSVVLGADGSTTLPSGQPLLFGNGNSRIQAGMGFHINSEEGIALESVNVADPANPVSYSWYFGTDGNLVLPAGGTIRDPVTGDDLLAGGGSSPTNEITNTDGTSTYAVSVGTDGVVSMNTARGGIEFGAMPEVGGPQHLHIMRPAGAEGATDLYFGDDYNYVKMPALYGAGTQGVEIGSSLNEGTVSVWKFGTDGKLTLPANSSILTNETALNIATSPTTTYTFNQAYWEAVDGDITRVVTPTGNAQYFACTVTANQDGTYTVGGINAGNSFVPGNWFKVPGNELGGATPANDIQITVATVDGAGVILTTTMTGTAVSKQWKFDTDGTTTLPGAIIRVVAGTVAKTGAINAGINKVATVSIEPTYDATWVNSYSVSNGGFSCDIAWPSAGNPVFGNIVDTVGNRTVGDTLATVPGSALGITGVDGVNDMVIKVATLTTTIATALDLTKSVNKLTNGAYTLANGVEGQIMYLVRQAGSTAHNVTVANARDNGTTYTDVPFLPFTDGTNDTNMATLIFTDSAWQSMGGVWSFT